ncbi:MAG: DUF167 family protein [Candidatus Thermoplasmatota archaeon]
MPNIEKAVGKHRDGVYLNLSVTPDSDSCMFPAGFNKWRRRIEIKVSSPAKDNKANKDVLTTLADFFNTPIENVFIVSGKKGKNKRVFVKDKSLNEIVDRLKESTDGF